MDGGPRTLAGELRSAGSVRQRIAGIVAAAGDLARVFFAAERSRWALWIPVFLGCGIALYFALPVEPAPWTGPAALLAVLCAVICCRRRPVLLIVAWVALLGALGFGVAQLRTATVAAPVLDRKTGPVDVTGTVSQVEALTDGRRLWLERPVVGRLAPSRTPRRIRVTIHGAEPALRPGYHVRVLAVLHPPAAPAAPGAFDFARRAFFEQLGAVGYAVGRVDIVDAPDAGTVTIALESTRQTITRRIYDALPGTPGAVAAALMTGERGAIPEGTLDAMRDSGLAHLLAISGLHIGLVGGLLFFGLRLSLAVCERAALRLPIKKYAAVAAVLGSLGYLLISGATLPTQRAFLMLCLVMLAVLLDRAPISMNLVAWAAGAILLIAPESLMSVSFQMSFAAVTALVAVYETGAARPAADGTRRGAVRRAWRYLAAVLLTTLVAGLATGPFALYHFNRIALYGMLANLVAVPLTALWVMPCAVLSFILMPVGLEALGLTLMGWGIDGVIRVAETVQALPGSVATLAAWPPWSLGMVALGGLWLCLWQRGWRFLGLAPVIGGAALGLVAQSPPDILVSETGRLVALVRDDGRLAIAGPARGFVAETWLRRAGEDPSEQDGRTAIPGRCDALGCIYRARGHVIADVRDTGALLDDCAVASVVLSRIPVRRWRCRGPELVVDRFDLWRNGPHAVWLRPDGIRVKTVGGADGGRPWSRYPRRPTRRAGANTDG